MVFILLGGPSEDGIGGGDSGEFDVPALFEPADGLLDAVLEL